MACVYQFDKDTCSLIPVYDGCELKRVEVLNIYDCPSPANEFRIANKDVNGNYYVERPEAIKEEEQEDVDPCLMGNCTYILLADGTIEFRVSTCSTNCSNCLIPDFAPDDVAPNELFNLSCNPFEVGNTPDPNQTNPCMGECQFVWNEAASRFDEVESENTCEERIDTQCSGCNYEYIDDSLSLIHI